MDRRSFILNSSGLVFSIWVLPSYKLAFADKIDRIGMSTVIFRYRFRQTKPKVGIEMNPDVHLRIIKEAGPDNIYTLPDFGNYPKSPMYQSLEKILPHVYLISARASQFNDSMEHISYFDKCVQLAEKLGFKGVYSVERWSGKYNDIDYEKVADWLIEHVNKNI